MIRYRTSCARSRHVPRALREVAKSGNYAFVYAEIGTTFASTVVTFTTVCAHILGQFLKYFGEDRIVFGSDTPWYGGPQWQIEALWRFQIPDDMARAYGHPKLTEGAKRKILGLNSARLYELGANGNFNEHSQGQGRGVYTPFPQNYVEQIPESLKTLLEFPGYTADNFSKARMAYRDWNGAAPRPTRFGWIRKEA